MIVFLAPELLWCPVYGDYYPPFEKHSHHYNGQMLSCEAYLEAIENENSNDNTDNDNTGDSDSNNDVVVDVSNNDSGSYNVPINTSTDLSPIVDVLNDVSGQLNTIIENTSPVEASPFNNFNSCCLFLILCVVTLSFLFRGKR